MRCDTMIEVRARMIRREAQQDLFFGVGVDGRQRIVQDQDARIDGDGAGERRALLLATRKRDAALADERVVAVGKVGDILVEPGRRGGIRDAPRAHVIAAGADASLGFCPRLGVAAGAPPACPALPALPAPSRASSPNATLSAIVSEKRNGSCATKPMAPRSTDSGMSRTSTPSMNTVPRGGSYSPAAG